MQIGRSRTGPGPAPQAPFAGKNFGGLAAGPPAAAAAAGAASSMGAAHPAGARYTTAAKGPSGVAELTKLPSVEDLALALHARVEAADDLLRSPGNVVPVGELAEAESGRPDANASHPIYGSYLGEWLQDHEPEPGRALLGFFRSSLGELREAISRRSDKFKPAGPAE